MRYTNQKTSCSGRGKNTLHRVEGRSLLGQSLPLRVLKSKKAVSRGQPSCFSKPLDLKIDIDPAKQVTAIAAELQGTS